MLFRILFLAFIIVPIIEIYLLIKVGSTIGVGFTLLLIIATAIIGAYLLRLQGISTLSRVQLSLSQGQIPAIELIEGILLVATGALLLTPGFFTDAIGFLGLIPYTRRTFVFWLINRFNVTTTSANPTTHSRQSQQNKRIIEGEYHRDN